MSPIGIATVVLPNRKTDNKAGDSGAAGRFDKRKHRHIVAAPVMNRDAARLDDCQGGSVSGGRRR